MLQITQINTCIQSSAIIMWSNLSRYYIWHCNDTNRFRTHNRASYGVLIMRILKKIDRIITAPHCTPILTNPQSRCTHLISRSNMIHSGAQPFWMSILLRLCVVESIMGLWSLLVFSGLPSPGRFLKSPRAMASWMRSSTRRSIAFLKYGSK